MKVRELIKILERLNPELDVLTNECEATSAHEEISELNTVEEVAGHVFVGTYPAR